MTTPLIFRPQDQLRQRRLERGLPAEPAPFASARRLLLMGAGVGSGLIALVLFSWGLIALRHRLVSAEIATLSAIPAQLQVLETQLRTDQARLAQLNKSTNALASGLVAASSGSALVTQLGQLAPQGVQITEAAVSGPALALKGKADDPGAFTRVNALTLLLAYAPLFKPNEVKVVKLNRDAAAPSGPANAPAAGPAPVGWDLSAGLATLKPGDLLPVLRKLGADGMARRLQDLARMGVLP